ncbi:SLBB domain-containing protein [Bacteroides helcogenes]|uniref:Polysaccharide export protein n=1 Tax=Bacteroides helcogenes (strain ATCC 35417 / DSM 20613 / JCM 6297 / CCUG 15421 / P 36-108) TaxID=693979 RepID=E6SN90_BACT6|nr:SLBB domain-containing protein [Bacteroides helcogenes]ADV44743.1 polysaccharide export protein [Bacteroides helcogenes P 36-108]MDY5238496.1 SLBB domain-containing protein [Bacteroides helcogenes]
MHRLITLFFLICTLSGVAVAQQMSDDQVIQYVKSAQQMGKNQKQITTELMRRGVTKEQVGRIQQKYENSKTGNLQDSNSDGNRSRQRGQQSSGRTSNLRASFKQKVGSQMEMREDSLDVDRVGLVKKDRTQQIYGHDIFTNENLTFEPNVNVATPVNYRLGPGDEVIIDVWGASEATIRQMISPEGSILVNNLGPVYLSGKTVKEANSYLKQEFARIYSGVTGNVPSTQVKLTLGEIRSIQVNVMGEVAIPGTYTLSSFASVFHALYSAGGVNKIGSLRSIKVVRNGNVIADLDIYDLLMKGKMKDDVRLQDGDVILVNPYQSLVQILGKIKRPMYYEMKPTETVATLLKYAGNFTGDAYKKAVRIVRKSGREHQIYNVDEMDYSVFRIEDGDIVTVDSVLQRFENRVEIRGAVYREGLYQLNGTVNTVKQLIKKAEGVRGDAFLNRAIIDRELEDLTHEIIPVDMKGLLNGTVADIPLQKNDILYIPSIHDLKEEATLTIHGEVANPGTYLYSDKMTVEDLIIQAGGLLEAAATTKIEVARRVKEPKSTIFSTTVGENFSFDLREGLLVGEGSEDFHLEPFDEVYIRKSPAYHQQQNVMVGGEVLFSGSYALSKKNERLSDLITKAGGITPDAYVKGARLIRKMTEEELRRKEDALRMAQMGGGDSISIKKMDLSDTYSVGISLEKALQNPGSDYDMVLREGDMLFVPEYVSTVKINGAVMYPNTVLYRKGENLRYYINQAGGFGNDAKKRKAYVVYMNGTVSRLKSGNAKAIEPGCEIIVPSKDPKKKMSVAEIMGMGTTTASLATMIATMVNLFK